MSNPKVQTRREAISMKSRIRDREKGEQQGPGNKTQSEFLDSLVQSGKRAAVVWADGASNQAVVILGHDRYTIVVAFEDGRRSLLYKHDLSGIAETIDQGGE